MSKHYGWIRFALVCHEDQERIIMDALRREFFEAQREIERLYATVTSGAIRYDGLGVHGGGADADRLEEVIDKVAEIRALQEERCRAAYEKLEKFRAVEAAVRAMDEPHRGVLLTLYYPRRTQREAAEILGVSEREVQRRRDVAVDLLAKSCG